MQKTSLNRRPFRAGILWIPGTIVFLLIYRDYIGNFFRGIYQLRGLLKNPGEAFQTFITLSLPEVMVLFLLGVFFLIFLGVSSAYILPATSLEQTYEIWKRLIAYLFRRHGAAVFVREGKIVGESAEKQRKGMGILLVDRKSAVIVEESKKNQNISIQVYSPGIVFTGKKQRIRGAVDLRPQRRSQPDLHGYTQDGIEITTTVSVSFTLGQSPDILLVAYHLNEKHPEATPDRLRVVQLSGDLSASTITQTLSRHITSFSNEIDAADQLEIHRYVQTFHQRSLKPENLRLPLEAPPGHYLVDPNRIIAAYYAMAHQSAPRQPAEWSELPLQVTINYFREYLTTIRFEDIYNPQKGNSPSLSEIKNKFSKIVRNQGVLAYQFVQRKDGQPLRVNDSWDTRDLIFYPVQNLTTPKILRDKGIKILNASFGELRPADQLVTESMYRKWLAIHQKNFKFYHAEMEYKTQQIQTQARKKAQAEMVRRFIDLLNQSSYSKHALLIQFFETLEKAATEPETRKLMPADTINMIQQLRILLLEDSSRKTS